MSNEIPRRCRMDQWTGAERAIDNAVQVVEAMAADVRLTDAVILLQAARESVADYVDNLWPHRRTVTQTPLAALGSPETPRDPARKVKPQTGLPAQDCCDCGAPLAASCVNCIVSEYQAEHPTCSTCCPIYAVSPQEDAAPPVLFSERKMFTPRDLDLATKPLHVEIERLKAEIATDDELIADLRRLSNLFDCPVHGHGCIPFAVDEVKRLRALLAVPEGRLRELAKQKMLADHIYAIECGPLKGHVDNRDDEDVRFGFYACPHPDCVLVRTPLASVSHPSEGQ